MKRIVVAIALFAAFCTQASAAGPFGRSWYSSNVSRNPYIPVTAPSMHAYIWPNGATGFDSPAITYGYTPSTVYSPWVYSPYSYGGYGNYGWGGYGWGAGF